MKKIIISLPEIKLVGITARTNNAFEMRAPIAKIPSTIFEYFNKGLAEKINHRKKPGITYCVYTEYENDFTGDYTYFIGEEVEKFDKPLENFKGLTIPEQTYIRFTNGPGGMPKICIEAWQKIWNMTPSELGGKRAYTADLEIYGKSEFNSENTMVNIYIALQR
jgi:predicted transcriptional regulator YdeE